jgi:hypothetical protein
VNALAVLLAFVLGCVTAFFAVRKTIGERRWRDGYLHGFNLAWDEKADADEKALVDRLKKIRKTGPKLLVIKGEKK